MPRSSQLRPLKQPSKAGNVAPGNAARKLEQGGIGTKSKSAPPTQRSPSGNCPTKKDEEPWKSVWEEQNISTC